MGLFLALSGVIGASASAVQEAVEEFAKARSGGFELAKGTTNDPGIGVISDHGGNTAVLYPNGFCEWDDASQHISSKLRKSVFSLHIHDGDLWMYILFHNGEEAGHFNPWPEYWGDVSEEEKAKWKGDAGLVAALVPGVAPGSIDRYLVDWDLEDETRAKAYASDEYAKGNCWQMCDFMEKLGLEYPLSKEGEDQGAMFRLWTEAFPLETAAPKPAVRTDCRKKPWWKFW